MLFQPGGAIWPKIRAIVLSCRASLRLRPLWCLVARLANFFPSQKGQVGPAEEHDPIPIVVLRHVRAFLHRAKLN